MNLPAGNSTAWPEVIFRPSSLEELRGALAEASARGQKIGPLDLSALDAVVEYTPEDMTVTAQAGLTLARLQAHLAERSQWLPLDPPQPERLSLGALLDTNASGPRRFGYGTVRDYLLGLRVVLADGRLVKAGGKVVKNVAGYDLGKLFVGGWGSLGVVVEATFKVQPRPEAEQFRRASCDSLKQVAAWLDRLAESDLAPVVLDWHNVSRPSASTGPAGEIVLGFAGAREDVEWQTERAATLGFTEAGDLDYVATFWADPTPPRRCSVAPSRLVQTVQELAPSTFVARAGNGTVFYRGGAPPPPALLPWDLMRRLKAAFDPQHLLPDLPP